jgi:hypothetical protein
LTFTPFTPGTFAGLWATRQVTFFLLVPLFARTSTRRAGHVDDEFAIPQSSHATFHAIWTSTTIGALAPILKVAFAIRLARFCAALMDFLSAACHWASFATMRGLSGDGVHAFLVSTTTSCRTGTVLAPTSFTINCACVKIASPLFFIAITMRTIKATLVSIDEAVFTSLQTTTALGGALSPSTPRSTDMWSHFIGTLLGHRLYFRIGVFSMEPQLDQTGTLLAAHSGQIRWQQDE